MKSNKFVKLVSTVFFLIASSGLFAQGPTIATHVPEHEIMEVFENLGDTIEFYSSLSGLYNFSESFSLEAEIGHISNGGLGDTNPGSESFVLSAHYHF